MQMGRITQRSIFLVIAVAVVMLLVPTAAMAAPVIADSYPLVGPYTSGDIGVNAHYKKAQSFTAIEGTLDSASFHLLREGASSQTVRAVLYAHDGTYGTSSVPSGPALAVSQPVAINDLPTVSPPPATTFSFDNTVSLADGQRYVIALETLDDSVPILVWVGASQAGPVNGAHPGNMANTLGTLSNWQAMANYDLYFSVYENPPAPVVVSTPASSTWSLAILASFALGAVVVLTRRVAA